jgi:uridine kinase
MMGDFKLLSGSIDEALKQKQRVIMALDGRCAAGKTTLAKKLSKKYAAAVIHMDDFFLPAALRRPERFQELGGNVHYERFLSEVALRLMGGRPFKYRAFDCGRMDYGDWVFVPDAKLIIVEGAYSLRADFMELYNIKVFMDIEPDEQRRRIIARNGEAAYAVFAERWIPLEEKYINETGVLERCDIVLTQ